MSNPFEFLRRISLLCCVISSSAGVLSSCEGQELGSAILDYAGEAPAPQTVDECASHAAGCPCNDDGATLACSHKEVRGEYVICTRGFRTCVSQQWSECSPEGAQPSEETAMPRDGALDQDAEAHDDAAVKSDAAETHGP
jgi:hypothetical protein